MRRVKSDVLDYIEGLVVDLGRMITRREYEEIETPTYPHVDVRDTWGSWNKTTQGVATRVTFDEFKNVLFNTITITTQPDALTELTEGDDLELTVVATGAPNLEYQWQTLVDVTWTDISGETDSTLLIENVALADAESYRVVVSSSYSEYTVVNSATAVVTVAEA